MCIFSLCSVGFGDGYDERKAPDRNDTAENASPGSDIESYALKERQ